MLEVKAIDTYRGPAHILNGVSLSVGQAGGSVPGRPQRRRQDHDHREHHGLPASAAGQIVFDNEDLTEFAAARTRADAESAIRPRIAASSRSCRSTTT